MGDKSPRLLVQGQVGPSEGVGFASDGVHELIGRIDAIHLFHGTYMQRETDTGKDQMGTYRRGRYTRRNPMNQGKGWLRRGRQRSPHQRVERRR